MRELEVRAAGRRSDAGIEDGALYSGLVLLAAGLLASGLILSCGTAYDCPCDPTVCGEEDCSGCPGDCEGEDECDGEDCPLDPCIEDPGHEDCAPDPCIEDPGHEDCAPDPCIEDPGHEDCAPDPCIEDPGHEDCVPDPCLEDPEHQDCVEDCLPPVCGEVMCGLVHNDCGEWVDCGGCGEDELCEEGVCLLPACPTATVRSGQATYYAATGGGNCSYPVGTGMPFVAAASNADYAAAALCGACIEVAGPEGLVVVQVVDSCPGCSSGHLDLSREAFAEISPLSAGLVPITWRIVPCDVGGPVSFFWEAGSDQWWSSVQVRGHRHPLATLEVRGSNGNFQVLTRKSWNVFYLSSMGSGPFDFRLTDVHGTTLIEANVPLAAGRVVQGSGQFPACLP